MYVCMHMHVYSSISKYRKMDLASYNNYLKFISGMVCALVFTVCTRSWQKWHTFRVILKSVHTVNNNSYSEKGVIEGPKKVCTYFLGSLRSVHTFFWAFSAACTNNFGLSPCCALLFLQSAQVFFMAATFCIKCAQFSPAKRL